MKPFTSLLFPFLFFLFSLTKGVAQTSDAVLDSVRLEAIQLRSTGDLRGAIKLLISSLQMDRTTPEVSASQVEILHQLGVTYYLFGQYDSAKHYMDQTIDGRLALPIIDSSAVARSYFAQEAIARDKGQMEEALPYLQSALSFMEPYLKHNPNPRDARRLLNMFEEAANLYYLIGDLQTANIFLDKAFRLYDQEAQEDGRKLGRLYTLRGNIFDEQRQFDQAELNFLKAIEVLEPLEDPRSEQSQAIAYNNLGLVYLNLGLMKKAQNNFKKALVLTKELYSISQMLLLQGSIAGIYANLGQTYTRERDFTKAQSNLNLGLEAGRIAFPNQKNPIIADLFHYQGKLLHQMGNNVEALVNYQKAIESIVPDFNADAGLSNPLINKQVISQKSKLLEILTSKAKTQASLQESDYLQAAFSTYQTIDTLITQMRQSYQSAGSRFFLMDQVLPVYEKAINVCLQLYEQTQQVSYLQNAYQLSAKNKALILLEGLQHEQAKSFAGIPEDLLMEEESLKQQVHDLENQIYELQQEEEDSLVQNLKDQLFQFRRSYTQLIDRFERDYPAYFDLKYRMPSSLDIPSIQQKLPEDGLVLEYFVGEEYIFIFQIDNDSFSYTKLKKPKDFDRYCLDFRQMAQHLDEKDQTRYLQVTYQLYQWILQAPLSSFDGKRLFVIPHGLLLQLSFEALVDAPSDTWQDKGNAYLLKKYAISYAYSNRLLFDQGAQERIRQAKAGFAGFGLEYDDYTLQGLDILKESKDTVLKDRSMGRLIYSDDEVRELVQLLGGQQWLNQSATKEAFFKHAPNYRILHLAMHGVVDEQQPMNSSLIFTRTSDSLDYLLKAYELYNTSLDAQMVVLSACNTGVGTVVRGEGVRSLARAFAYAGAPSMIATLWSASDKSTKDILVTYYQNLQAGMSKDMALQAAKLSYLEKAPPTFAIPFYWSHLIVIGDATSLDLSPTSPRRLGFLLLAIAVGLVFLWFRRTSP